LINNSFDYAPPYLPLYGFMQQTKKWPMLSLSVMEWEDPRVKAAFMEYVKTCYPDRNRNEVLAQVENWKSIQNHPA